MKNKCNSKFYLAGVEHECDLVLNHAGLHKEENFNSSDESFTSFEWNDETARGSICTCDVPQHSEKCACWTPFNKYHPKDAYIKGLEKALEICGKIVDEFNGGGPDKDYQRCVGAEVCFDNIKFEIEKIK